MRHLAILPALLLASCGAQEPTPEDLAANAERDVAMVEEANNAPPPVRPVLPEPITFQDIEEHSILGAACNYAPGTSLGTRIIAREADAFAKLEGEVIRFAADAGSSELPAKSWSDYDGREFSLRLAVEGEGRSAGGNGGKTNYTGTIDMRDRWNRPVYNGTGLVQCDT